MLKLLLLIVSFSAFASAQAGTSFINPSNSGLAFKAKGLLGSNKKLADRICFLLTKKQSDRALDYEIGKRLFLELAVDFPKTLQPSSDRQLKPVIISDVLVQGPSADPARAEEAAVSTLVEMGNLPSASAKYFSSISCE